MSPVDRAAAALGFLLQQAFRRTLRTDPALAGEVERSAARLGGAPAQALPGLRYRVRRDGLTRERLGECFGLYAVALLLPPPHVITAGARLMHGGVVELAAPGERRQALALAALALALRGDGVHLLAASEAAAQSLHQSLEAPFASLGLRVGCVLRGMNAAARREAYACDVVCAAHREVAQDHLRDRTQVGAPAGPLGARLERLDTRGEPLMPRGLASALVDDADLVLLDDALAPAAIAAEVDQSRERLLYEQALELARALVRDKDFTVEEEGIRLTEPAARLLERLVAPLGGVWSGRERREQLIGLALDALHLFKRDVDYRVHAGRVLFPQRSDEADKAPGPDDEIQKLVEVKEGCRLSARREILARLPMPRFFSRYRHLAGTCADARGAERDLWTFYALPTWLAGPRTAAVPCAIRFFASAEAKSAALVAALGAHAAAGRKTVLALRSAQQAQALQPLLQGAGLDQAVLLALLPAAPGLPLPAGEAVSLVVGEQPDARRQVERMARACQASSAELFLSLDDEAVAPRLGVLLAAAARRAARADGEIEPRYARWLAAALQRRAERASRDVRLDLKTREQMLDDMLAFSGQRE